MFFRAIEIENFRAIKRLRLEGLANTVVIAGPNGCGKSSIFDAIRLVKSAGSLGFPGVATRYRIPLLGFSLSGSQGAKRAV